MINNPFKLLKVLAVFIVSGSICGAALSSEMRVHVKNDTNWTLKLTHNSLDFPRIHAGGEAQLMVKQLDTLVVKTSGKMWNKFAGHDLMKDLVWGESGTFGQITISGGKGTFNQYGAFMVSVKMVETVAQKEKEFANFEIVSGLTKLSEQGLNYESLYLANIPVCSEGANVLNGFRLIRERLESDKIGYAFKSTKGLKDDVVAARFTTWNEDGVGSAVFLDRHPVSCEANEAITGFQLAYDISTSQIRYEYGCRNVNLQNLATYETEFNDDGQGANIYLERHNVQCPGNTVLNSFQLVRNEDQAQYKYVFKCGEIA